MSYTFYNNRTYTISYILYTFKEYHLTNKKNEWMGGYMITVLSPLKIRFIQNLITF